MASLGLCSLFVAAQRYDFFFKMQQKAVPTEVVAPLVVCVDCFYNVFSRVKIR